MIRPKAGQLWSWYTKDVVYLVKRLHTDADRAAHWEWIDLGRGLHYRCPLTVGLIPGWELLVDV